MSVSFVRQLGSQSGVQLNPLRDDSEIPTTGNSDQIFAIAMRATRGRIDKPFRVNSGNVLRKLGRGESIKASALNEAWVHVVEALNNGAYEAVVQRLATSAAVISWAKVSVNATTKAIEFATSPTEPTAPYLLAIKHLECHNDGIKIEIASEEKLVGGVQTSNDKLTLRILDSRDDVMYEFYGSLNADAKDDYGNSLFLPDVVTAQTDAIEVSVGVTGADAVISTTSNAYGYDAGGQLKAARSGVLVCFTEGGTAYTVTDYTAAREKLQNSPHDFAYISSGGTQNAGLLAQLAKLAFDTNAQLRFDVPGNLTPTAAMSFVESLNMGASPTAHLMQAFWAPFKSSDPTGVNRAAYYGVATLNIAYACARNAQTNAKGFAPKNYPIAGRQWPINRIGINQTYFPKQQELSALAAAKINPAVFESYTGGGRYVFRDSLTCALVESSLKKLISVADMSTSIDDAVTRFGKDVLQLPMDVSIRRMNDFLRDLFNGAEASGWLVPSSSPDMGGKAWKFDVRPNEMRPYDRLDVSYWLRFDGVARQIFVTQTLTR